MLALCACSIKAGNLTFDFYKESYDNGKLEKIGGFIYMKAGSGSEANNIYFHITYPVNQIMVLSKKETQVYYPDEKKAIIMENSEDISKVNFMEPATKKMDLKSLGFKLVDSKKSKEGSKEVWAPGNIVGVPIKSILLERDGKGRLLKMEMKGKDGNVMTRLEYQDYVKIGNKQIPFFIKTYAGGDKGSYEEMIKITNFKENSKLPEIIQNFKIPEDAKISKVKF